MVAVLAGQRKWPEAAQLHKSRLRLPISW
jgi:hypothetical protein